MRLNILFAFLVVLGFIACEQGNNDSMFSEMSLQELILGDEGVEDKEGNSENKNDICFELIYPLSVTMPDGSVLTGNENDLWDEVKGWYETNSTSKDKPSINYPIEIIWKGNISKTIADKLEMKVAKKYCSLKKEDCFKLVYPISWTMGDGSVINMTDELDWETIKIWYVENPDSEEKFSLNYPVDIVLKDGNTKTIANDNDMLLIKKDCK